MLNVIDAAKTVKSCVYNTCRKLYHSCPGWSQNTLKTVLIQDGFFIDLVDASQYVYLNVHINRQHFPNGDIFAVSIRWFVQLVSVWRYLSFALQGFVLYIRVHQFFSQTHSLFRLL